MGHISNINVPKNKVKTLNSCSLFSKSCCVSCYRKMYTVHTEPITLSIKYSNMLFYWLSLPPSLPSHSHPHTHTLPEGFSPQWLSQPSCGLWEQPAQAGSGVCLFLRVCVCVSHQLVHCGRFTHPPPPPTLSHIAEVGVLSALSLKLDTWGTLTEISTRQELLSKKSEIRALPRN